MIFVIVRWFMIHVVVRSLSTISCVAGVTARRLPHSRAAECATCWHRDCVEKINRISTIEIVFVLISIWLRMNSTTHLNSIRYPFNQIPIDFFSFSKMIQCWYLNRYRTYLWFIDRRLHPVPSSFSMPKVVFIIAIACNA